MKVEMDDFRAAAADVVGLIADMQHVLETDKTKALKDIGGVIQKETKRAMRRSLVDLRYNASNYDGSTPYVHMEDDISHEVRGQKTGVYSVVVHGGKKTAYKWHMLDDGTHGRDGSLRTPATHFTQSALKASEQGIDAVIDELERKVSE